MKTLIATACALVLSASVAHGAEYFIYKDPAGRVVLSNVAPPPAAAIVGTYELPEATDEELRRAREVEERFWQELRDERRAEAQERLAESNLRLARVLEAGVLRPADPVIILQAVQEASRRVPFRHFHRDRFNRSAKPGAAHTGKFR